MSEKVTFQELVDSISEQTGQTKQFTHDFLKDLVSVINGGLESDGNVTIAGLGKFELRQMDEREGYNPQTGEKMTIPAHNKVVFKPYKGLRELVNAPYAYMEPKLLEDETEEDEKSDIPEKEEQAPEEFEAKDEAKEEPAEMEPVDEEPAEDETEEERKDIVEFIPDMDAGDEEPEEAEKPPEPAHAAPGPARVKFRRTRGRRDSGFSKWLLIAAAFIVLLIAVMGWYLVSYTGTEPRETAAVESQAPAQAQQQQQQTQAQQPPAQQRQQQQQEPLPPTVSVEINEGQTLWSLASNQYGNPFLWPWIYDMNESKIGNPNLIYAGQNLTLPSPERGNGSLSPADSLNVALGYLATYHWFRQHQPKDAKYYVWAAHKFSADVLEHADIAVDESDLAFARNRR